MPPELKPVLRRDPTQGIERFCPAELSKAAALFLGSYALFLNPSTGQFARRTSSSIKLLEVQHWPMKSSGNGTAIKSASKHALERRISARGEPVLNSQLHWEKDFCTFTERLINCLFTIFRWLVTSAKAVGPTASSKLGGVA